MGIKGKSDLEVLTGVDPVCLNAGLMKPRKGLTPVWAKKKTGGGQGYTGSMNQIS